MFYVYSMKTGKLLYTCEEYPYVNHDTQIVEWVDLPE
jgi:hypothetical protein